MLSISRLVESARYLDIVDPTVEEIFEQFVKDDKIECLEYRCTFDYYSENQLPVDIIRFDTPVNVYYNDIYVPKKITIVPIICMMYTKPDFCISDNRMITCYTINNTIRNTVRETYQLIDEIGYMRGSAYF